MSKQEVAFLRIAYLANTTIPSGVASSIHVMKMCSALARAGHRIRLFVPGPGSDRTVDPFRHYGVDKAFRLTRLPAPGTRFRGYLSYGTIVRLALAAFRPDLVYARCHGLGVFPLARMRTPFILEMHMLRSTELVSPVLANRYLRGVVVISDALKDDCIREYGLDEDRVVVAPDAADAPPANPPFGEGVPEEARAETGDLTVGYAGNLYAGKGMETLLELAARLPRYRFHVIGGDPAEVNEWRSRIETGGISNLCLHGAVPHRDVGRFLLSCDVLVAPYRERTYGVGGVADIARWMSPLKIPEYMAAGKPIVASDLPAVREMLTDGVDGILCPPSEIDAWVRALLALERNAVRAELGRAARATFDARFSWDARVINVIRLAGRGRPLKWRSERTISAGNRRIG